MAESKGRRGWIGIILGAVLAVLGILSFASGGVQAGIIPFGIGAALIYLGWRGGRTATIVFGHVIIVLGCYMVTWGLLLLPRFEPTISGILGGPLFWGLISIFGGICANYHGFCRCVAGPAERS
jgi:hypothetical protein